MVQELSYIEKVIKIYVQDYNQKLDKNLLANEDFFGDTIRIIDFLNNYYKCLILTEDQKMIAFALQNLDSIRKYITGLASDTKPMISNIITDDEYRQAKKGVHKVRKMIPSIAEKQNLFQNLLTSYHQYEENFKNQIYTVYTNDNIYNFEIKEEYFPRVVGLNLEDKIKDVDTRTEKEKDYYRKLPEMLVQMSKEESLKSLDRYEHKHFHSLFNYSYVKVKNYAFLNFTRLSMPMIVINNQKKIDSNIKTNTFFASLAKVGEKNAYSVLGFHENSKFSQGCAESDIYLKDSRDIRGELGITTAIFKQNKMLPPHHFELVRLFTIQEQIDFIDYILSNDILNKNMNDIKQYQSRLKRTLCDQINLEYQLRNVGKEYLQEHTR